MNEPNQKMELLGSAPISKALLALGLPTMTGMLINALYSLADTYFVGGLGTDQMGAVTVAFPLGQIVVGLGLLFGNRAAACARPFKLQFSGPPYFVLFSVLPAPSFPQKSCLCLQRTMM